LKRNRHFLQFIKEKSQIEKTYSSSNPKRVLKVRPLASHRLTLSVKGLKEDAQRPNSIIVDNRPQSLSRSIYTDNENNAISERSEFMKPMMSTNFPRNFRKSGERKVPILTLNQSNIVDESQSLYQVQTTRIGESSNSVTGKSKKS